MNFNKILQYSTPKKIALIWQIKRDGINAAKLEPVRIHFLIAVLVAFAVVVA